MAYLGIVDGPKLSEILIRYRHELLETLTMRIGSDLDRVPAQTIGNLIAQEKDEESKGLVVPVTVPVGEGVKPGEFLYERLDSGTDSRIKFYYMITDEEKRLLGDDYEKKEVNVLSPD